ncbi:MAG: hypothetical protein K1X53_05235 [Candidatus Sumerlaeaceae bacterium]|nr:hypothetical protein [Candidatus Sumerlaeaceae bacterium]
MMVRPLAAVILSLMVMAACHRRKPDAPQSGSTEPPVFALRDGKVILQGWDDVANTSGAILLRLNPQDFEQQEEIRGGNIILQKRPLNTRVFVVPESAKTMVLVARAEMNEGAFPRVRVSAADADSGDSIAVYEGFVRSLSMASIVFPVPFKLAGKQTQLTLEILEPNPTGGRRVVFVRAFLFR